VLPVPRAAKLGPPKAGCQHGAVPEAALLHHRLLAVDVPWQPTIPRAHCARTGSADVRCEEYDGRVRSQVRPIPDRGQHISRPHVHEGGGRADAQRADKELQLLRRVDTEQHQDSRVRHTAQGPKDVGHVHRQYDRHPGDVQARIRTVHVHVQA